MTFFVCCSGAGVFVLVRLTGGVREDGSSVGGKNGEQKRSSFSKGGDVIKGGLEGKMGCWVGV